MAHDVWYLLVVVGRLLKSLYFFPRDGVYKFSQLYLHKNKRLYNLIENTPYIIKINSNLKSEF